MNSRLLALLCLGALATRLVHAFRVPLPSIDGSHYLAMAEALARFDLEGALRCVFHPGKAILLAPLCWIGIEPFTAARVEGALTGACAVWLVYRAGRCLGTERAALVSAALLALGFHGVRLVSGAQSETVYLPLAALTVLSCLRGRLGIAGLAIGLAFWVRPEALALGPLLFLKPSSGRRALGSLVLSLAVAGLHPLLRFAILNELALTPKLGFMAPMGPLGEAGFQEALRHLAESLVLLPLRAFEGLDLVFPLAVFGLVLLLRRDRRAGICFFSALAIGQVAMLCFQVKARFFLSQLPLFLPLAALALSAEHRRLPRVLRPELLALLAIAVSGIRLLMDCVDPPRRDKLAERQLGLALRGEISRPEELVTDMPRIAWYAGLHPPPPAIWDPERLGPLLEKARVRYVVLGAKRPGRVELMSALDQYERIALPRRVAEQPGSERLLLHARR